MIEAGPSAEDLRTIEVDVAAALARRDPSSLNIIGFGELAVALGWPSDDPAFVCKRTGPLTRDQFESYEALIPRYVSRLAQVGISCVPTEVRSVDTGDRRVAYVVQPMVPKASLVDQILGAAEPSPNHPVLCDIAEAILVASPTLSVDAQVTNWSWTGGELQLLDVGTPFMWDSTGAWETDMAPFLRMLPFPVRGFVQRDMTKLISRWQTPKGAALDLVANLYREDMADWVPAAVEAMNRAIRPLEPITADDARSLYVEDLKTFPRLKRMQQLERSWQTRVRRRPYQFFIQSTFGGSAGAAADLGT